MSLEREFDKSSSSKKSFDKSDWLYGAVFIGVVGVISYLCIQIGQYILEKTGPNLPTPSQYIPFQ